GSLLAGALAYSCALHWLWRRGCGVRACCARFAPRTSSADREANWLRRAPSSLGRPHGRAAPGSSLPLPPKPAPAGSRSPRASSAVRTLGPAAGSPRACWSRCGPPPAPRPGGLRLGSVASGRQRRRAAGATSAPQLGDAPLGDRGVAWQGPVDLGSPPATRGVPSPRGVAQPRLARAAWTLG